MRDLVVDANDGIMEELQELAALYEAKGLSPALALQVANELSTLDAVTAHADAEHGTEPGGKHLQPVGIGVTAMFASLAIGSLFSL